MKRALSPEPRSELLPLGARFQAATRPPPAGSRSGATGAGTGRRKQTDLGVHGDSPTARATRAWPQTAHGKPHHRRSQACPGRPRRSRARQARARTAAPARAPAQALERNSPPGRHLGNQPLKLPRPSPTSSTATGQTSRVSARRPRGSARSSSLSALPPPPAAPAPPPRRHLLPGRSAAQRGRRSSGRAGPGRRRRPGPPACPRAQPQGGQPLRPATEGHSPPLPGL